MDDMPNTLNLARNSLLYQKEQNVVQVQDPVFHLWQLQVMVV